MSEQKYLGKIEKVKFGRGGYDDAMLGLSLSFSFGEAYGITDFINSGWTGKRSKDANWTEADRDALRAKCIAYIDQLLNEAKVYDVTELKGKPVEILIENNALKSWRILTEVL